MSTRLHKGKLGACIGTRDGVIDTVDETLLLAVDAHDVHASVCSAAGDHGCGCCTSRIRSVGLQAILQWR